MPDYVRIKDKGTGHEFSMPAGSFDESAATVLDKPATDPGGEPLPVKYHTTKSGQAATSKEK